MARAMPFACGFRVASPFGIRADPITGEPGVWHGGVDLVGLDGDRSVRAAAGGTVLRSRIVTDPADRTSEWNGDLDNTGGWGTYIGVPQAVGRMVSLDCCTHEVCDTLPLFSPRSTTVVRHCYVDGTGGCEVRLYEVLGGKHTKAETDMDTAEEVWNFFSKFVRQ